MEQKLIRQRIFLHEFLDELESYLTSGWRVVSIYSDKEQSWALIAR